MFIDDYTTINTLDKNYTQMRQRLSYERVAYRNFINSLKSPPTRKVYGISQKIYLKYNNQTNF